MGNATATERSICFTQRLQGMGDAALIGDEAIVPDRAPAGW